jgi:CD163 antigen
MIQCLPSGLCSLRVGCCPKLHWVCLRRPENFSNSLSRGNHWYDSLSSESPELRLVGGRSHCAGRIEILHQDTWGTICDDSWDLKDAQVVCRQLGCGVALNAMTSAHFGAGSGPIWLSEVNCIGKESHVWKCPSLGWHKSFCDHNEDAGVICSGMMSALSTSWRMETSREADI